MLTIAEAKKRTEAFLAGQMLEALRAVEYEMPSFDDGAQRLKHLASQKGFSSLLRLGTCQHATT